MKKYPKFITWCRAFRILSLMAVLAVSSGCTTMQGQAISQQKAMVATGVTNTGLRTMARMPGIASPGLMR